MKTLKPAIAAAELALIFPAALFMAALFIRNVQPEQFQPAHTAAIIVDWYAHGPVWLTLWILLMAMPSTVLASGCVILVCRWKADAELRRNARKVMLLVRAHFATLLLAAATLTAAGILGIVALHAITD